MMIKSSSPSPLLLLGVTCCLLLLVQESQGLKCYLGPGDKLEDQAEKDCLTELAQSATHTSCKTPNELPKEKRDRCVKYLSPAVAPEMIRGCGCSEGMTKDDVVNKCHKTDEKNWLCSCDKDLCNIGGFDGSKNPEDKGKDGGSGATSTFSAFQPLLPIPIILASLY